MEKSGQTTEAQVSINQGDVMPFKIDGMLDTSKPNGGAEIPTHYQNKYH